MLVDNHGREINYLRLAVTDRCNLRCFYCMPEEGINYIERSDLLTFEEMHRLIQIVGDLGVSKVRITGGEPFVRKGIMEFLQDISKIDPIRQIHITTNGTFTESYIPQLEDMGIRSINLSLDSLDKGRFFEITRRNLFEQVMSTYHALIESSIDVKINMVVMDGRNIEDIYPMIEQTRNHHVSVRFIEEMPFNGTLGKGNQTHWPIKKILSHIERKYNVTKLEDPPHSTSSNYKVDGFEGSFGIIAAYTRTFCGTCNRIRVTPQGGLRTCLYGHEGLSIRDAMRSGMTDAELAKTLIQAISTRPKDGFEAENYRNESPISESMATIGG
jgi:molybdenum cofactor biosynthesis protein A